MAMKGKQEKIKQNNKRDFNLLYNTLLQGGTFGDYKSELLDKSLPQEKKSDVITEDDILQAWILGKDEEQGQFARGGHMHQGGRWMDVLPEQTQRNIADIIYSTPPSFNLQPDTTNVSLGFQSNGDLMNGAYFGQLSKQNTSTPSAWTQKSREAWDNAWNSENALNSGLAIAGTLADWGSGMYYNTNTRLDNAQNKIDADLNMILGQRFGTGDTSYLASQYRDIQRAKHTSIEDNGGMSGKEGLLNGLKSTAQGAMTGLEIGGPWGALIGGIAGAAKGAGEWFLNRDAAERKMALNNLKADIANQQTNTRFADTATNSNRLYNFNQLTQPYDEYLGACGGKMKHIHDQGGYLNSHYDYITDPLVRVDAGGTHQENPNEGVQTSIAPDGQPNLVEEGETIIDNGNEAYVFSDRIVADEEILKNHLLPDKFKGKTYADISKELDKIIEEHKTDEISKRTFDEMTKRLQDAQEDQKYQEKAAEVAKFIDGLSDEEKQNLEEVMVEEAQAQAEQQAAAQQAAQEQAMAEQQAAEQQQVPPQEQVVEQPMEAPVEEHVPSRYDQMMSRAAITDAANGGMFARGGHLHQEEFSDLPFMRRNYLQNVGMRRDANTGNLLFNELVREPITSNDPLKRAGAHNANSNYLIANSIYGPNLVRLNDLVSKPAAYMAYAYSTLKPGGTLFSYAIDEMNAEFAYKDANDERNLRAAKNVKNNNEFNVTVPGDNGRFLTTIPNGGTYDDVKVIKEKDITARPKGGYYLLDYSDYEMPENPRSVMQTPEDRDLLLTTPNQHPLLTASVNTLPRGEEVAIKRPLYGWLHNTDLSNDNNNRHSSIDNISEIVSFYGKDYMKSIQDNHGFGKAKNTTTIPTDVPGSTTPTSKSGSTVGTGGSGKKKTIPTKKGGDLTDKTPIQMTPVASGLLGNGFFDYVKGQDYTLGTPDDRTFGELRDSSNVDKNGSYVGMVSQGGNPTREGDKSGFNWLRYAPAIGSGLQALSDALGITNKPDYSNADLYQRSINAIPTVNYVPIGSYLNYMPMDETYQQNAMRASSRANARAIANNAAGNAGAALAGLNALNFGTTNALGDLGVRVMDYNNQMGQRVAEHNLKINAINANNSLSAQEKNQAIAAEKARLNYNLAQMRQAIEDQNDLARAANRTNLFTNLGNIGRENFIMNQINDNPSYYYQVDNAGHITYKNAFYEQPKWIQDIMQRQAEEESETKKNKKGK